MPNCPHVWEYDETNHRRCVGCGRRETPCPIGFCEDWRELGGPAYCESHGGDHDQA